MSNRISPTRIASNEFQQPPPLLGGWSAVKESLAYGNRLIRAAAGRGTGARGGVHPALDGLEGVVDDPQILQRVLHPPCGRARWERDWRGTGWNLNVAIECNDTDLLQTFQGLTSCTVGLVKTPSPSGPKIRRLTGLEKSLEPTPVLCQKGAGLKQIHHKGGCKGKDPIFWILSMAPGA